MGNHPSNHQPLEKGGVSKFGDVHARRSLRSPRKMDRLRRSFRDSFRKRKERVPESSKPHQWQSDEAAVRAATCTFAVKYLGCVEVFESRGMQVCEEAIKVLRGSRRRPVRATLHISGDGLRVVEDETKGLIVDQTIEKVSFCAPDRNHERGFSYICRDGTTRRWMCHGFLALRESGERLSHAVGCAFAVCLERKQRRDKECGVTMMFDARNNTFTRTGSFRTQGLTERLERDIDVPPNNNIQSPPGGGVGLSGGTVNPFAIERPHATPSMLERQGSFRGLGTLGQSSPFKRQMSLRVSDLPSNTERLSQFHHLHNNGTTRGTNGIKSVSPIPEMPNNSMNGGGGDSVTALCQQLSQGLSQLTHSGSDDFNFNSRSSVNQNNIINESNIGSIGDTSATSPTLMQLHSPTSPSLATPNITSLPTTSSVLTSPGTMNFSQNSTNSVITPIKAGSPPANRLGGMIVPPSSSALPRPEQWLGQIVSSASPPQRGAGGGTRILAAPPSGMARRGLALSAHSRAMSLDSHEIGHTRQGDPFDADWANMAARQNSNNTNPFLSTANAAPQPFQVQL